MTMMTLQGCGDSSSGQGGSSTQTTSGHSGGSGSGGSSNQGGSSGQGGSSTQTSTSSQSDASVQTDASGQTGDFEIRGNWLFLGPADGPHTLKISSSTVIYTDVDGTWSSTWTLQDFDNDNHHFRIIFQSGTGTYYPVGEKMSGTYDLNGTILTVQLADGLDAYPPMKSAGSCTEGGATPIPDCALYVQQN